MSIGPAIVFLLFSASVAGAETVLECGRLIDVNGCEVLGTARRSATLDTAMLLGVTENLGTIDVGKSADIVATPG